MSELPQSKIIEDALKAVKKQNHEDNLTDEDREQLEKTDALPDVDPCEISDEVCELASDIKEKMFLKAQKAKVYEPVKEIKILISAAEQEMLDERAYNAGMDVPTYIKWVALNTKVNVDLIMDEAKSAYELYYGFEV